MTAFQLQVTPWPPETPLAPAAVEARMQAENLPYYRWSNGPGDVYGVHHHSRSCAKKYSETSYAMNRVTPRKPPTVMPKATEHIGEIIDINWKHAAYAGPNQWNDPDMLEIGTVKRSSA